MLPLLLFGRPLHIISMDLDRPMLNLLQDDSGRWNLLRAFDIALRTGEPSVPQQSARTVPSIPAISVSEGTINITDARQRSASIAPVTFHGEPDSLKSVHGTVKAAFSGDLRAVMQLGLLLLIATPIARVMLSAIAFAVERDRMYVLFTLIVLTVLMYSLFLSFLIA